MGWRAGERVRTPASSREDFTRASIQERQLLRLAPQGRSCSCWAGERDFPSSREPYSSRLAMGVLVWWEMSAMRAAICRRSSSRSSGGGGGAVQGSGPAGPPGRREWTRRRTPPKAVVNGLGQHPVQPVRLPSGAPPVVQAEQDAPRGREGGRGAEAGPSWLHRPHIAHAVYRPDGGVGEAWPAGGSTATDRGVLVHKFPAVPDLLQQARPG